MSIHLTFDRLILDGLSLPPGAEPLLREALGVELARLLREGSLPAAGSGGALAALPAEPVTLPPGGDPALLGAQIARSLFGSLGGVSPRTESE